MTVQDSIEVFAPAKVNLTLEVLGRRSDGYHELRSLVAFATNVGDRLVFQAGEAVNLSVSGPEAISLNDDNLITRVLSALGELDSGLMLGSFALEKRLPVAAGLGGGSADAAAALRAVAGANDITDPDVVFAELALQLGADIPVCIGRNGGLPSAAVMSGIGEKIWRPERGGLLPDDGLAALLVNPRVAVPTGSVFAALNASPIAAPFDGRAKCVGFRTFGECLDYITAHANDLEAPALRLAPAIGTVLVSLRVLDGCRFAAMSGSGATCFGLFENLNQANVAAQALRAQQPGWWIAATTLV